MTKSEISANAAKVLEDEGFVHFTTTDLSDAFDDGWEIVTILTGCLEKMATIQTVADQLYYDLTTLIPDYYRVFAIWSTATNRWLDPISLVELKEEADKWEVIQGPPRMFSPLGYRKIVLHPTPTSAIDLYVLYTAVATKLNDSDSIDLPTEFQHILEKYMVGDLLQQNLEYEKSQRYIAEFYQMIAKLKLKIEKRSWPDRVMALAG